MFCDQRFLLLVVYAHIVSSGKFAAEMLFTCRQVLTQESQATRRETSRARRGLCLSHSDLLPDFNCWLNLNTVVYNKRSKSSVVAQPSPQLVRIEPFFDMDQTFLIID
jgi:hypothetical protein